MTKRGGKTRPGIQVRVDYDLAVKLKVIAGVRGERVGNVLSRLIREDVERMYRSAVRDLDQSSGTPEVPEPRGDSIG